MVRGVSIPEGFEQDFLLLRRLPLREKYGLGEQEFRLICTRLPKSLIAQRRARAKKGLLKGDPRQFDNRSVERPEAPRIEKLAGDNLHDANARLQNLIAQQKRANAARPDPYAGLTGFDRQLAIAKAKGVTRRLHMPARVSAAIDAGLGMSSAFWAVGGGADL